MRQPIGIVLTLFAALWLTPASATDDRVEWRIQSLFNNTWRMNEPAIDFARDVEALTDGKLKLNLYGPGDLVNPVECFDAITKGLLEGCWTLSMVTANKLPAAMLFSNAPFGLYSNSGTVAWLVNGEGYTLREELYNPHGVTHLVTNCRPAEVSFWFTQPVDTVEDFKGLKMRFFGIGAKVMKKLGVQIKHVPWGKLVEALEAGELDGVEAGGPAVDLHFGFRKGAKYLYSPAWHAGPACIELIMSKEKFDALPEKSRRVLQIAAKATRADMLGKWAILDANAYDELSNDANVVMKRFSDEQLAAIEKTWREVLAEEAAKDPSFRRVADSLLAWQKKYRQWDDVVAPKHTYLK